MKSVARQFASESEKNGFGLNKTKTTATNDIMKTYGLNPISMEILIAYALIIMLYQKQ